MKKRPSKQPLKPPHASAPAPAAAVGFIAKDAAGVARSYVVLAYMIVSDGVATERQLVVPLASDSQQAFADARNKLMDDRGKLTFMEAASQENNQ